jgi:dethiobiotin synthetase
LTASYARGCGIGVRGFIINNFHPGNIMEEDNKIMIERLGGAPVLACVEKNAESLCLSKELLTAIFDEPVGETQ